MTNNQRIFADEYLVDRNGTRAYMAAYPRVKNAEVARRAASRLLTNVDVKIYLDDRLAEISSSKVAEAREVMEYLTSVLRGESRAETIMVEGMGEGCSRARRLEKAPDEKERLKAAELLGRHMGMFTENVRLTAETVKIIDDIPKEDNSA